MGKASIIYVIGLGVLLIYYVFAISDTSTRSMTNSMEYHTRTMAHNAAVAGANIGTSRLLMGADSILTFSSTFGGVPFSVTIDSAGTTRVITAVSSAPYEGKLGYGIIRDTVIATLQRIVLSRYAYFSGQEANGYMSATSNSTSGGSMWKVTGDSMFGYAHTNTRWNLGGRPYFDSKVTAFNPPNTMTYGGVYDPIFNGGTQWGITVNRPQANLTRLESMAGASSPVALVTGQDVALTFIPDGTVAVKIPALTGTIRNETVPLSSLTSNGIIAVKGGDIRVQGTYKGQVTLTALSGSSPLKGNIWIDGDIRAATNPRGNPGSNDMLGLVAERMAYVTTTDPVTGNPYPRNSSSVLTIQAAIYTQNGVFAAENYDTVPVSGRIDLFGGVTMNASTSTGRISGGALINGFLKSIRHDPRFLTAAPPGYPVSDKFLLVSWWEN
jgi:hypothetical protein